MGLDIQRIFFDNQGLLQHKGVRVKIPSKTSNVVLVLGLDFGNKVEDIELLGFEDAEERLTDRYDGELSMGTEADGLINGIVEFTLFPESVKPSAVSTDRTSMPAKDPKPPLRQLHKASSLSSSLSRSSSKLVSSSKKTSASSLANKTVKCRI